MACGPCGSPWRSAVPRPSGRSRPARSRPRPPWLARRSPLLLGGPVGGRAAIHLDALARVVQRPAVPLEPPVVLFAHVAVPDRFACGRKGGALGPVAAARLRHPPQG